jgi:hypothetical protein
MNGKYFSLRLRNSLSLNYNLYFQHEDKPYFDNIRQIENDRNICQTEETIKTNKIVDHSGLGLLSQDTEDWQVDQQDSSGCEQAKADQPWGF